MKKTIVMLTLAIMTIMCLSACGTTTPTPSEDPSEAPTSTPAPMLGHADEFFKCVKRQDELLAIIEMWRIDHGYDESARITKDEFESIYGAPLPNCPIPYVGADGSTTQSPLFKNGTVGCPYHPYYDEIQIDGVNYIKPNFDRLISAGYYYDTTDNTFYDELYDYDGKLVATRHVAIADNFPQSFEAPMYIKFYNYRGYVKNIKECEVDITEKISYNNDGSLQSEVYFYENGRVKNYISYSNGIKIREGNYNESGSLKSETNYNHYSGKPIVSRTYNENAKQTVYTAYDASGAPTDNITVSAHWLETSAGTVVQYPSEDSYITDIYVYSPSDKIFDHNNIIKAYKVTDGKISEDNN